jgi:hypothetical protein
MRIKLIIAAILTALALFCYWRISYLTEQNTLLKAENTELKTQWEKEKENVLEASKRIQKLNKVIADNSAVKSWADTPINDVILSELRKQHKASKD